MKGITKEFTIWCNCCAKWEQKSGYSRQKDFIKDMISGGDWVNFKGEFYCKECDDSFKEKKEELS